MAKQTFVCFFSLFFYEPFPEEGNTIPIELTPFISDFADGIFGRPAPKVVIIVAPPAGTMQLWHCSLG